MNKPQTNEIVPEVKNFKDMIAYQEGAVVSRTIIKKKTGTVTLFAFAEGQELSEHSTPYDALVEIVDGEAEIMISGELFHPKQGESIVLPANQPHAVKATQKFKMLLTMIKSN